MTAAPGPPADTERLALVRAHDRDRYISALLAPADARMDLILLAAFDAELARIPATVSEPLLGEIRLQWWRDALAPLLVVKPQSAKLPDTDKTGNPLADDLIALARRRALPGGLLHGLIDARSAEISDTPFADDAQLWAHIAKTEGAMLSLAAAILGEATAGASGTTPAAHAIGLLRIAQGLLTGRSTIKALIPVSMWPQAERTAEGVTSGHRPDAVTQAARRLLDLAEIEFGHARNQLSRLARPARPAFLPLALIPRYVTHLRRQLENPSIAPFDINPLARVWTLWRARHIGRFV
jgi:15-cis-phytoene synthase